MTITHYSEKSFAVDIVSEAYNTTDPVEIVAKAKEILNTDISVKEAMDFLTLPKGFKKGNSVKMKHIFDETSVV